MPTVSQCPKEFDVSIWEKVKDEQLNDQFLLYIANELNKQNLPISDVCHCLEVDTSQTLLSTENVGCYEYKDILGDWQLNCGKDGSVGKLIFCLSKIEEIQCSPLCDICKTSYKTEEENFVYTVQESTNSLSLTNYSACDSGFPEAEDQVQANTIYSELVHGRVSIPFWLYNKECHDTYPNIGQFEVNDEYHELFQVIESIQKKFATLIRRAYLSFESKPVPVKDLQVYLSQRCADRRAMIPLFEKKMNEIIHQSSHHQIFMLMSRIRAWDFLDFSLLQDAVIEFNISDLESVISSFENEVKDFQTDTKLIDFLRVWKSSCIEKELPACELLIAKCEGDMQRVTLADVAKKAKLLAGKFNLLTLAARLGWGHPGSMYILWYIPEAVARHIEKVMESKKRPQLVCYGVQQLVVGRKIYQDCGMHNYTDNYQASISDPEYFFGKKGLSMLQWMKPFKRAYSCTVGKNSTTIEWFSEGKLNVSVNCLDRHEGSKTAVFWEPPDQKPEQLTYRQLLEMTCKIANVLKDHDINKGDRVIIYMPAMPLTMASMLACARMGAVHCVVFSDFDVASLKERIIGTKAKCIITANERVVTKDQVNPLKVIVDEVMKDSTVKSLVKHVFVARRTESRFETYMHDVDLDIAMSEALPEYTPEEMDSEDELLIAYTSGTGEKSPRGIVHTQAGFLFNVSHNHKFMFSSLPGDVICCVADLGWMAGHTCVLYGPLCNGETTVLFEGVPWEPHPGRYWEMVERLKITHFYTIPCVLQKLKNFGDEHVEKYDLSSLKIIAVAGEPLQLDIEDWYFQVIGRGQCLLIDGWGQTEIAALGLIHWRAPSGQYPAHFPAEKTFALFGVDPYVEPSKGSVPSKVGEVRGALYLKKPIPSMGRKVIEHSIEGRITESSFADYYFNKENLFYETFDMVKQSPNKELQVIGRLDNSIRIKGVDWMPIEVANQVSAIITSETKNKLQSVEFCELREDKNELYAILQAKQSVGEEEKTDIVRDVKDAYKRVIVPPDDNLPLRFVFTDASPISPSGKRSLYQLMCLVLKLRKEESHSSLLEYQNISVKKALKELGTTVFRHMSFSN